MKKLITSIALAVTLVVGMTAFVAFGQKGAGSCTDAVYVEEHDEGLNLFVVIEEKRNAGCPVVKLTAVEPESGKFWIVEGEQ
ncbi:MAG: hypothetical protein ABL959_21890 [Pyrinomonadaceae bacterium]